MKNSKITIVILCSLIVVGCENNQKLDVASQALFYAADKCMLDVRDLNLKYEDSPNCTSLDALATLYIEAGGFRPETPNKYQIKAEQARVKAWQALAISESDKPFLSIW
ncbi:MAG: hypothetical protein V7718_06495 [Porticoccus sp.]